MFINNYTLQNLAYTIIVQINGQMFLKKSFDYDVQI